MIYLVILRDGTKIFVGKIGVDKIVRGFEDIVSYLYRHTTYPNGCFFDGGNGHCARFKFYLAKWR